MNRIPVAIMVAGLGVSSLAFGDTLSFAGSNTDLGPTHTFLLDGFSVVATGFIGTTQAHLFDKGNGGDENGLGLTSDPSGNNEIYFLSPTLSAKDFVQLDVLNLLNAGFTSIQFEMGSTSGGEQWSVSACSASGVLCNNGTVSGSGDMTFTAVPITLSKTNHYLDFYSSANVASSSGGNVLLSALSATSPVPEPRYAFLLGGALLAVVVFNARRNAAKRA